MKDLGFGLVDQRSVIVVLMTATLCHILGLSFPLHTDNILLAFIDLVFLTGYLYLSRSIIRFPFAFFIGIKRTVKKEYDVLRKYYDDGYPSFAFVRIRGDRRDSRRIFTFLVTLIDQDIWKGYLGFIDRLSLITITVLVTLPMLGQSLMTIGGSIGIAMMLLIYLLGGTFSFIVEDALKRSADQRAQEQREFVKAAGNHPKFPSAIETYTVDHRYDNIGG